MLYAIEMLNSVKPSRQSTSSELPEQIIEVNAAGPVLPTSHPEGKIVVRNNHGRMPDLKYTLNCRAVVAASDDVYSIATIKQCQRPVPAYTGFGPLVRLTRICRQEKLHACSISCELDNIRLRCRSSIPTVNVSYRTSVCPRAGTGSEVDLSASRRIAVGRCLLCIGFRRHLQIDRCAMNTVLVICPKRDRHALADGAIGSSKHKRDRAAHYAGVAQGSANTRG